MPVFCGGGGGGGGGGLAEYGHARILARNLRTVPSSVFISFLHRFCYGFFSLRLCKAKI